MALSRGRKALIGLIAALAVGGAAAGTAYVLRRGPAAATVNGAPIPAAEFREQLESEKAAYASRFGLKFDTPEGKAVEEELRPRLLGQMIDRRLALAEAEKRGLKPTEADIQQLLQQTVSQFPDRQAFVAALAERHSTPEKLEAQIRENATFKALGKALGPAKPATPAEVAAYYRAHPDDFRHPEEVKVRHILVKDEALGQKILAELAAGGSFADLADAYSEDPGSKLLGGELPYFGRGRMAPEFEQAAFALKPGARSGLVKTQFGYHVIEVQEHRAAGTAPLAEVETAIATKLMGDRRQAAFEAWLTEARKQAVVTYAAGYEPAASPAPAPAAPSEP